MTIPTRPAPAPPQLRSFNTNDSASTAAADANASLEQLRLQLQNQQQKEKLTIKLPHPPKVGSTTNQSSSFSLTHIESVGGTSNSSIIRNCPKTRYAPVTNWNDSPFDPFELRNGSIKKVPPPRPPPPNVLVNGRPKITTGTSLPSTNIFSNIFHRKKGNNSNNAKDLDAARNGNNAFKQTQTSFSSSTTSSSLPQCFLNSDWNGAWNSDTSCSITTTSVTTKASQNQQEAQLISFDSPPSSPTFTQKSNSDCVSVDSFSSDSNFSSPQNGSVSQTESGFEDDFTATSRSRPSTISPPDPWETFSAFKSDVIRNSYHPESFYCSTANIGTAPVRNLGCLNSTARDNPLCNGRNLVPSTSSVSMPTIIKPKISQKPKAPRPPTYGTANTQCTVGGVGSYSKIPQCDVPPSPPIATSKPSVSILDVISGKADAIHLSNSANAESTIFNREPSHGIALYDFDGAEKGDLSFKEGEKIYLLEQVSDDWYRGRTRAGCEGILPVNYIEIKVPLFAERSTFEAKTTSNSKEVRCLYNFPAEIDGDLELKENDVVTVLYRINEDWLFGKTNNKKGQFPANFIEYVPANIPLQQ